MTPKELAKTPEERAREIVTEFLSRVSTRGTGVSARDPLISLIATAIREAEARGLERAAKIRDDLRHPEGWSSESVEWVDGTEHCTAAIRAEKERTP